MHFKIDTIKFKEGVNIANHASIWVTTTPILENILIQAAFWKVILTTNNLEMAIEYTIDEWIDIKSEGTFTISNKFLSSFLSLIREDTIEVKLTTDGSLLFKTESVNTKFKWIPADEFPKLPVVKHTENFSFNWKIFKDAVRHTIFSAALWNIRPTLAWIYINILDSEMIFASTDSFRLSEYSVKWPTNIKENTSLILPSKTASELSKIISEKDSVNVYKTDTQFLVSFWNIKLYSRLLNGAFPDYRAFFPNTYSTKAVVNKQDLISALKQINLLSKDNNYSIKVLFEPWVWIEIDTWDIELWKAKNNIVASTEWDPATIWLNSLYVLDVLNIIKSDYISIDFETPLSPIKFQWVSEEKEENIEYKHIIMPLKV